MAENEATGKDFRIFCHANILLQLESAEFKNGYYILEFYSENGKPSAKTTEHIEKFYLYPSGGTLRDSNYQLLFYDSKYDTYRGFKPPHVKNI
ncbi:MAG: hypothetical protein HY562_11405 [Ignavibacteriales bacterium]|nr:hypothetical protein [Ignavibacteriales bacterium]